MYTINLRYGYAWAIPHDIRRSEEEIEQIRRSVGDVCSSCITQTVWERVLHPLPMAQLMRWDYWNDYVGNRWTGRYVDKLGQMWEYRTFNINGEKRKIKCVINLVTKRDKQYEIMSTKK